MPGLGARPGRVTALRTRGARPRVDAALVVLADGPISTLGRSNAFLRGAVTALSYAAAYHGVRLHPVLLARAAWEGIPDEGARSLAAVEVDCTDLDPPGDVDSAADLPERLQATHDES